MLTLIYGRSGSGKSRSMKNLDPNEVLLINVQNKMPPFRQQFPRVYVPTGTVSAIKDGKQVLKGIVQEIEDVILKTIKKYPSTKVIVIDDAGYLMTKTFMARHRLMKGNQQFDLYNEIGDDFWNLFNFCSTLPESINTYIMMHEETSDFGETKLKTIGRLLDQKVVLEGMTTVCLRCMTDGKQHWFQTQNTGNDISKSPEEMFPADQIENDLKTVDGMIREYYGLAEPKAS